MLMLHALASCDDLCIVTSRQRIQNRLRIYVEGGGFRVQPFIEAARQHPQYDINLKLSADG